MNFIPSSEKMLQELCKAKKKFGIKVHFVNPDVWDKEMSYTGEIKKAIPFLDEEQIFELILNETAWLLFDTRKEMQTAYDSIVGDDGPTKLNPYNGPIRIYAITCNNKGQLENENT
ncbi:MAG: hypothetical protein KGO96_07070 [Elusimicrobia bacterium]|nr:hypothetical protein [Elusimicrobiota bacterium]